MPRIANALPRILIIGPTPPPYHGGAVFTAHVLGSTTLRAQFDFIHLDTSDRRDLTNVGRADLGNIWLALVHGSRFMHMLATRRPDLVYIPLAQNTLGYLRDLLFLLPARLLRKKIVVHFHGAGFDKFYAHSSKLMRLLIHASLSPARRVIVLGEGLRYLFGDFVPTERTVAVPNGIPDLFPGSNSVANSANTPTVLFLSNLMREKGIFVTFEAAQLVVKQVPGVKFIMAGPWFREEDRLVAETVVQDLGLNDFIQFPGMVSGEEKLKTLAGSSLLVFPPVGTEGLPLVLLEAMCAGLPVVTTRQGAIPDVVQDGVTGYVVEPANAALVAERILRLLSDDELRQRMGQAGRERFLGHYTLAHCTTRLAEVFHEVLAEP